MLLGGLLSAGALLASLYQLYYFEFRGKTSRSLVIAIFTTFSILIGILFILINLRLSFIAVKTLNSQVVAGTFIIVPLAYIGFAAGNEKIGCISPSNFRTCAYIASWMFLPPIFIIIITGSPGLTGTCAGVFFLSLGIQNLMLWAMRIGKISPARYRTITLGNACIFTGVTFLFFFTLIQGLLVLNLLIIFLATCFACLVVGLFAFKLGIFPPLVGKLLTCGTLYFFVALVLYYAIPPFLSSPYLFLVPPSLGA